MSTAPTVQLSTLFAREYGSVPQGIVRAPGRVNLIGEHTDYNGLPVFPMAIQRAVTVAFRARPDGRVRVCDADPRYPPREFALADGIAPFEQGDWGNYAKAAAQALRARARVERGIDALVDGDIPQEAGLASSSAMVVACTLALAAANGLALPREELMELTAGAERYVGTHSGGMDQAICIGARAGHASVIEFDPVRLDHVIVPEEWSFVIANSLVRAHKAGAARESYNARTRECREALRLLLAHPRGEGLPRSYRTLVRDVPEADLLERACEALPESLLRRFRHVVTEGRRVGAARAAMLAGDAPAFGRLMNDSHASLRDDYEVSCRELDDLVDLALRNGALGARLTGAGFGGCTVSLVARGETARLTRALAACRPVAGSDGGERAFAAAASAGADVALLAR